MLIYENYVPAGELVLQQLMRDQVDFLVFYKKMDGSYVLDFKTQIDAVKSIESTFALTEKQKGITTDLYALCDTTISKMEFLRTYVKPTGLNYSVVTTVNRQLRNRNVEGAVKTGKEALAYFEANRAKFIEGNMPDDFLTETADLFNKLEEKNTEQNMFLLNRSNITAQNTDTYDKLYKYIAEVCEAGKLVYKKNEQKRKEYTLTYLNSLLRAASRTKE